MANGQTMPIEDRTARADIAVVVIAGNFNTNELSIVKGAKTLTLAKIRQREESDIAKIGA
jgi:hypothetical protein